MVSSEKLKQIIEFKENQLTEMQSHFNEIVQKFKSSTINSDGYELITFTESRLDELKKCLNRMQDITKDLDIYKSILEE